MGVIRMTMREVLAIPRKDIWNLPMGHYDIVADNGEVIHTRSRPTVFSRYCWGIFERYPHVPLCVSHHAGDLPMSRDLSLRILSRVIMSCRESTPGANQDFMAELWKIAYEDTNSIFNDMSYNLEEYVTSICAIDFAQLIYYPPIKDLHQKLLDAEFVSEEDISRTLHAMAKIVRTDRAIRYYPLIRAVQCEVIRLPQVLQIIGPLGHRGDVDGKIYNPAILNGYGHGIVNLRDAMIESRESSRNLFYQKKPMRDSEWGNRIVQIMAAVYRNVHEGDCGSTDYLTLTIQTHNHLRDSAGAFRYDEPTRSLIPILVSDYHLIGKTINVRSIGKCKHPDRYGFCSVCVGELSYSIPTGTMIGHTSCTVLLGKVGQLILSQKHFSAAGVAMRLQLPVHSLKYLVPNEDGMEVRLMPALKGRSFKLLFSDKEVSDLLDANYVTDINKLRAERLSSLSSVVIETMEKGVIHTTELSLGNSTNKPSFSLDFIRYLRDNGWDINDLNQYVVDMGNWNFDDPVFVMPLAQFSAPMYMAQIQAFIKGGDKQQGANADNVLRHEDFGSALMALSDIVGLKLSVNILHLQVILQAIKTENPAANDYRPPADKRGGVPRKFNDLMFNRSLSAALSFQGHGKVPFMRDSFLDTPRPPHPFDHILRIK